MVGTAKEVNICGRLIKLGDKVKVKYTGKGGMAGGTIEGEVVELWSLELDNHLQGRVEYGWCFHDQDEIIEYTASGTKEMPTIHDTIYEIGGK